MTAWRGSDLCYPDYNTARKEYFKPSFFGKRIFFRGDRPGRLGLE